MMFNGFSGNNASNIASAFGNLFKPKQNTADPYAGTRGAAPQLQSSIPNYKYAPYQISGGDTFDTIAANNNLTVPQIQGANNGILVPPPKGSMINLPANVPPQYQRYVDIAKQKNTTINPLGVPPQYQRYVDIAKQKNTTINQLGVQAQLNPYVASNGAGFSQNLPAPGGSFTSGANVNTTELQANITQLLMSGQLPPAIPAQVAKNLINPTTGRPFSDADYLASGMTYNNMKKQWENPLAVTGGAGANGANPVKPPSGWDTRQAGASMDNGKFTWVRKNGRLVLVNNKRRGQAQVAAPVVPVKKATNAGSAPSQQVNTNQAGG